MSDIVFWMAPRRLDTGVPAPSGADLKGHSHERPLHSGFGTEVAFTDCEYEEGNDEGTSSPMSTKGLILSENVKGEIICQVKRFVIRSKISC